MDRMWGKVQFQPGKQGLLGSRCWVHWTWYLHFPLNKVLGCKHRVTTDTETQIATTGSGDLNQRSLKPYDLQVAIYIPVYIYSCIYIPVYIHIFLYIYIQLTSSSNIYIYIYPCIYIPVYIFLHIYSCIYKYIPVYGIYIPGWHGTLCRRGWPQTHRDLPVSPS